ncbi:MAG: DOMON domain-containing protein [Spirochaetia bacterium]|jgi:hypothetical protein
MKRSTVFFVALCLLLALGAGTGFAQSLAVTANKTVVDGVVHPDEYSFTQVSGPLTLYANRTASTLNIALTGKTRGWVAVGLGSLKMNGASIFIGYVGNDGKVQFKPQLGSGHSHKDTSAAVISYAIRTEGDTTTMEIALNANEYVKSGQASLDLIFAMGEDKSFVSYHSYRSSLSLKLG